MEKYEELNLEIVVFEDVDVIGTSQDVPIVGGDTDNIPYYEDAE